MTKSAFLQTLLFSSRSPIWESVYPSGNVSATVFAFAGEAEEEFCPALDDVFPAGVFWEDGAAEVCKEEDAAEESPAPEETGGTEDETCPKKEEDGWEDAGACLSCLEQAENTSRTAVKRNIHILFNEFTL